MGPRAVSDGCAYGMPEERRADAEVEEERKGILCGELVENVSRGRGCADEMLARWVTEGRMVA